MTAGAYCHACAYAALLFTAALIDAFTIPDVTFKVSKPKGLEVSIPDTPGTAFFAFNGNINREIGEKAVGTLKYEILQATDGRWVAKDPNVELKTGDVIYYYVFVSNNGAGYVLDNQTYIVPDVNKDVDPSTTTARPPCRQSLTKLRGTSACAGQVIFEDHFNDLRSDVWQVEQYIPRNQPEYPFVSYQGQPAGVVTVSDGYLHITPKLQEAMPGFTNKSILMGTLDLFSGCTASADECFRQADGPDILPPVASGRVTSSSFAFTYGTVYIRAKLPQGDWIYPEMLLEPFMMRYGRSKYASGVIKIASARGNKELRKAPDDYGNKVLYGGPVMDYQCRYELLTNKLSSGGHLWGDDFHEFAVKWTPDNITLYVDDEEWARVDASVPLYQRFPKDCEHMPQTLLSRGTNLAPFDDHFYLTLGVAVGGLSEFPDHIYSGANQKPWTNLARKAMLRFWQDLDSWYPTWTQPELLVDYVKVVAL